MAYCASHGIPHSIFLGRGWPTPGEALWLPADRAAALAWAADRDEHCATCGQRRSDWLDAGGTELRDPPYEVVAIHCPSCAEVEMWRKEHRGQPGLHLGFRRVPDDEDP